MSRASQPVNQWIGLTFIADNPRMEVPPAWFLARLHDYDSELVMLPSRARPFAYVLARRSRVRLGEKAIERSITQPDTKMCFHYGLVPVCLIFKHGPQWNVESVLQSLKARDTWTQGGGDALADTLEAEEAKVIADRKSALTDRFRHLSKEAWHSLQYRTGQRTTVPGPSQPGAATKGSSSSTATGITLH